MSDLFNELAGITIVNTMMQQLRNNPINPTFLGVPIENIPTKNSKIMKEEILNYLNNRLEYFEKIMLDNNCSVRVFGAHDELYTIIDYIKQIKIEE